MLPERLVIIATTPGTPVAVLCKIPSHALLKSLPIDVPPWRSLMLLPLATPLAVRAERCQPIQRVEVGLQFDCPNAGCANESPSAAPAAIAIGVLIMRWLQVSIEFRPSVAETRLISFGRLGIPLWNRKRQDPFFCRGMSAMLTLDPSSVT